jgi:hypothetical protein
MKQVLDVDKQQPLVTAVREEIVLGRGERFELRMDKIRSRRLSADELQRDCEQLEQLIQLRSSLGRPPRVRENNWSRQQLQTLRNGLPAPAASSELLVALLQEARKDVDRQDDRVGALQAMTNAAIGKPAPAFALTAATGAAQQLSSKTLGRGSSFCTSGATGPSRSRTPTARPATWTFCGGNCRMTTRRSSAWRYPTKASRRPKRPVRPASSATS